MNKPHLKYYLRWMRRKKKDKGKTCTHPTMKEPKNNGQKEEE